MKIHILGICGTFMGGLAQILKESGHQVSGSDIQFYPPMSDHLDSLEIELIEGYSLKMLPKADLYVIGNALSRGNESVEYILNNQLPFKSGPEILGEILKDRKVLAVSGTHGKTTTSYMLAHIFLALNKNIGYLVGGVSNSISGSASLGSHEVFVIEADEYDSAFFDKRSKFIHYSPSTVVINNIEFDHADIFSNVEEIESKFFSLLESLDADSMAYINKDAVSNRFLEKSCVFNVVEAFSAGTTTIDEINKNLATKALSKYFSSSEIHDSLKSFSGVKRRYDVIFENDDFKVIDDFAHHPTAIIETLKLAKKESFNVILILELGSNSMRKGIHDEKLIEIMQDQKTFTINASQDQLEKFSHLSKELNLDLVKQITSKPTEKHIILMCGNRNFSGFQKSILDALI